MTILAFDTSTAQGSVALIEGEKVLSERVWLREKSHSEFLTAQIEAVLNEAKTPAKRIEALAIGHGPGSFTGLRVSVNAAKALAYALGIDVYTYDTNETLIRGVNRTDLPVLTLINAQKNAFFAARYLFSGNTWRIDQPLEVRSLEEVSSILTEPHLCVGDGCLELAEHLPSELRSRFLRDPSVSDYPLATLIGQIPVKSPTLSTPMVWNEVQALYIRQSGAEEKIRGR